MCLMCLEAIIFCVIRTTYFEAIHCHLASYPSVMFINISFVMSSFQQVQILYFFRQKRRKKVQVLSSIVLSFRCVQNLLCRVILQARPHSLLHCVIFWRYSKSLHCCAIFSVFKYSPPPCDLFWFPLCTVEFHYS
jgi:hypothetical protein